MSIIITSRQELREYETKVVAAAEETSALFSKPPPTALSLFRKLKFDPIGRHPLENTRLNFIEQLNQTFTYIATFRAVRRLFEMHKDVRGYKLNLGTESGFDILSDDGGLAVAAEVFAAVSPKNNSKLRRDLKRVSGSGAKHKYVFFFSPGSKLGRQRELERDGAEVEVWSVEI